MDPPVLSAGRDDTFKTPKTKNTSKRIDFHTTPRVKNTSKGSIGKENDPTEALSNSNPPKYKKLSLYQSPLEKDNDSHDAKSHSGIYMEDDVDREDDVDDLELTNSRFSSKARRAKLSSQFSLLQHSVNNYGRDSSAHSSLSELVAIKEQSMHGSSAKKNNNWSYLKKTVKKILPGRKKNEGNDDSIDLENMQEQLGKNEPPYQGPTPFHTACHSAPCLRKIEKSYLQIPQVDLGLVDAKGRTPLDLIFQNRILAQSLRINHSNDEMITFDDEKLGGVVKFALSIIDHSKCEQRHFTWDVFTEWIEKVEDGTVFCDDGANRWFSMIANLPKHSKRLVRYSVHTEDENAPMKDEDAKLAQINMKSSSSSGVFQDDQSIVLPVQVMFALRLLSGMINELNHRCDPKNRGHTRSSPRKSLDNACLNTTKPRKKFSRKNRKSLDTEKLRNGTSNSSTKDEIHHDPQIYISSFASIPNLMKTFLLIDNDNMRKKAFEVDIMRRAMLSKQSIEGPWLSQMLQHHHRKRATEYLLLLSNLSTEEARNAEQTSDDDMKLNLKELFQAIGELEGFLPSMHAIDNTDIEELATTPMITKVLDEMITTPFASTLFFFDFFFLGLLIFFFRSCVDSYLQRQETDIVMKWLYGTLFSAFHFQMRAIGRVVSLLSMTRNAFFRNATLFNVWNVLHTACSFMVIWCIITIRFYAPYGKEEYSLSDNVRGQFAITTLLLWFNLLGLVKSINVKLATFVCAIVQIVKDVLWYVILIAGMVLCFSQVFYTMLIPSDCVDNAGVKDCKPAEYYLLVYSVLLGELDDELIGGIEDKLFALVLFFAFSFIMAIVMLNILIAVISDSYEKTMVKSRKLFGRARVHQLAEILALQDLFRVREDNKLSNKFVDWTSFQWTKGGFAFFIITTCVYVLWAVVDLSSAKGPPYMLYISISVFLLSLILFIIFLFLLASAAQSNGSGCMFRLGNCFVTVIHGKIQWLMVRLLGKSDDALLNDQWAGRLMYIKKEIAASTEKMEESIQIVQQEMRVDEKKMVEFRKDFHLKMNHFEEQMEYLLQMKAKESGIEVDDEGRITI